MTNVNTDPLPILLRCVGPEDPDQEDVFNGNGRAKLDAFCDRNQDGVPQEDEFMHQLTIKDRVEKFQRSPTIWLICQTQINTGSYGLLNSQKRIEARVNAKL